MGAVPKEVVWLVSFVLVEAAIIDGRSLRVPNWLTYHFLVGGLIFAYFTGGSALFLTSLAGAGVGLLTLLPLYSIGGMGAGDVKLMAGLGAWMGPWLTMSAFVSSALIGAAIALAMMAYSGKWYGHLATLHTIGHEVLNVPQSCGSGRARGPAEADGAIVALRHSHRDRFDRLLRLGGTLDLIRASCGPPEMGL